MRDKTAVLSSWTMDTKSDWRLAYRQPQIPRWFARSTEREKERYGGWHMAGSVSCRGSILFRIV